jgi:membrane-associated phospholipid phosphatase
VRGVSEPSPHRVSLLLFTGLGSATAFALMARAVARRKTAPVDHQVHAQTAVEPGHPVREAAEAAAPIGKWKMYLPAAVLTAGCVAGLRARSRAGSGAHSAFFGAAAIVVSAAAAALINKRLDALPQPVAPPGRPSPDHPVFPSGHAFGTSAVALTAAYVLTREELAGAAVAFPVALTVPIASSLGRMMEEKHWLSDVIGGHVAGLTLASLTCAAYEAAARANVRHRTDRAVPKR